MWLCGELGMGVAWAWVCVMGNRWRDLDQIWHGGSPQSQEDYRLMWLCGGRGVGVAWAWVGVIGNRWRDMDQIWHRRSPHPQEGYGLCGYVVGVAGGRVMGVGGRVMGVGGRGEQTVEGFGSNLAWTFPTHPGRLHTMWICGASNDR